VFENTGGAFTSSVSIMLFWFSIRSLRQAIALSKHQGIRCQSRYSKAD